MYKQLLDIDGTVNKRMIQRVEDNASIPVDEANTDYQAFLLWKSEGNEPLPADE
jgi:hypothetical protein